MLETRGARDLRPLTAIDQLGSDRAALLELRDPLCRDGRDSTAHVDLAGRERCRCRALWRFPFERASTSCARRSSAARELTLAVLHAGQRFFHTLPDAASWRATTGLLDRLALDDVLPSTVVCSRADSRVARRCDAGAVAEAMLQSARFIGAIWSVPRARLGDLLVRP